MTDPTRTIVLRSEYAKVLKSLLRNASRAITTLLNTRDIIDESTIKEIKRILETEIGGDKARAIVERYSLFTWRRGSEFAVRQLKRAGLAVEIPPYISVLDDEKLAQLSTMQLELIEGLSEEIKKTVTFKIRQELIQEHDAKKLITKELNTAKWKIGRIAQTEIIRVFNFAMIDRFSKAMKI
jgi:hypothetical protein